MTIHEQWKYIFYLANAFFKQRYLYLFEIKKIISLKNLTLYSHISVT